MSIQFTDNQVKEYVLELLEKGVHFDCKTNWDIPSPGDPKYLNMKMFCISPKEIDVCTNFLKKHNIKYHAKRERYISFWGTIK